MRLQERWVESGSVRLHCLEQTSSSPLTPLLIVPGTFGMAEDYLQEMEALAPRRCITVSLRGRGRSDVPASGYRFEDHVADIAATVAQIGLSRFALMGYSMGAAYALGYALEASRQIAGIIVGDYPARYPALAPKWVDTALESMGERARPEVARALQRDSAKVLLWDRLDSIECPVLILRGGQPGSRVTDEMAAMYLERLRSADLVTLDRNGHDLWKPDFEDYIGAIGNFIELLDDKSDRGPLN